MKYLKVIWILAGATMKVIPLLESQGLGYRDSESQHIMMIQRRLSVGFNRATRLMEELEAAGVIGPAEGTKTKKFCEFSDSNFTSLPEDNYL